MSRLINLLRNVAFPLGIAVALTFGATQAVGQMRTLDSCPWYPPYHLGECQSPEQCNEDCRGYDAEFGDCDQNNCCGCFFK
jgi:hypothetical protein